MTPRKERFVSMLKTLTLSECCDIVSGATPQTSVAAYWDGDIHWATPKDLSDLQTPYIEGTPRKITEVGLKSCAASILPPYSVLFSSRAPIGHVAINTVPMAANQGFKSFIPKPEIIDAKFLFYWLRKNKNYLEGLGNGATFKEVSKATVARIQISLPPISEQRRIAAILDQADALRVKRREALAQLDSLTQSIFIEMFGDPLKNPRNWKSQSLSEICDEINDCPHSTPVWTDEGKICLRTSNLTEGGWNWSDTRYVSEATYYERSKRGYIISGDIVLSREGTVGVAAIVAPGMTVCMGQRLVHIRPSSLVLVPEFLLRYLLYILSPRRIGQMMVGSTSQHLNVKELKALCVLCPPMELQQEFVKRVGILESLKSSIIDSLEESEALFASLQHRAFRGEL